MPSPEFVIDNRITVYDIKDMKNILSIDVEDYYHVCDRNGCVHRSSWDGYLPRVEANLFQLFDLLDLYHAKATCFFLGYIAHRHPHLVKEALHRGHDIASHGMYHEFLYNLSREQFATDVRESKKLLEDISGVEVTGYRAPGFSINQENHYVFEALLEQGYQYDSSLFPGAREFGDFHSDKISPFEIVLPQGTLIEFPITAATLLNRKFCFSGGGFLRIFPKFLIRHLTQQLNKQGIPILYYIHPREIDPTHPRLPMSRKRAFKSYVNLSSSLPKLHMILYENQCISIRDYIKEGTIHHA